MFCCHNYSKHIPQNMRNMIYILGGITILRISYNISSWIWKILIKPSNIHWNKYKGDWAIITGSSYGIGKSYALAFAKRGVNVALIARTESKLKEVSDECKALGVESCILPLDLNSPVDTVVDSVRGFVSGINGRLSFLVNNAGGMPGSFQKLKDDIKELQLSQTDGHSAHLECERLLIETDHSICDLPINIINETVLFNSLVPIILTRVVLPYMLKQNQNIRKRYIINISSLLSKIQIGHGGNLILYSISKSFVDMFSMCMNQWGYKHNIHIQAHLPGSVLTQLNPHGGITPDKYVDWSMKRIGSSAVCVPHPLHALQLSLITHVPRCLSIGTIDYIVNRVIEKGKKTHPELIEKTKKYLESVSEK
eukprot:GHVR01120054.1.p1 GENE.GHVR01120054.1~~GHVR01120054.1.p1  ORF type:complete len:367 (-),score=75.68 GHVR01120054.1:370-1470(-)